MAVYKVIQDIEAEDKLLGPLGLKQFIYAIVAFAFAFLSFKIATLSALGPVRWPILLLFLIPMFIFGVLAAPLGGSQPTEIWLLARLRFMLKPQKRIWDQSGMRELVTITAPKRLAKQYTDGLSQREVRSRLNALATTLDSRGWAVKNVNVNSFSQPGYFSEDEQTDRLITTDSLPQTVPIVDVRPEDDILDAQSNATAHHLDRLMQESSAKVKLQALGKFNSTRAQEKPNATPTQAPDFWFMHQSAQAPQVNRPGEVMFSTPIVARPSDTPTDQTLSAASSSINITPDQEAAMLNSIQKTKGRRKLGLEHLPTLDPSGKVVAKKAPVKKLTPEQQTAIISLADNDVYSIATVAKEAKRQIAPKPPVAEQNNGEIVVQLH